MAKVEQRVAKSSKADKALWAGKGITLEQAKEKLTYSFVDLSETKLAGEVAAGIDQLVEHCKDKVGKLPSDLSGNLVTAMDSFGAKAKALFLSVTIQADAARVNSGLEFAPRTTGPADEEVESVEVDI